MYSILMSGILKSKTQTGYYIVQQIYSILFLKICTKVCLVNVFYSIKYSSWQVNIFLHLSVCLMNVFYSMKYSGCLFTKHLLHHQRLRLLYIVQYMLCLGFTPYRKHSSKLSVLTNEDSGCFSKSRVTVHTYICLINVLHTIKDSVFQRVQ